jgi:hypothetical protein
VGEADGGPLAPASTQKFTPPCTRGSDDCGVDTHRANADGVKHGLLLWAVCKVHCSGHVHPSFDRLHGETHTHTHTHSSTQRGHRPGKQLWAQRTQSATQFTSNRYTHNDAVPPITTHIHHHPPIHPPTTAHSTTLACTLRRRQGKVATQTNAHSSTKLHARRRQGISRTQTNTDNTQHNCTVPGSVRGKG